MWSMHDLDVTPLVDAVAELGGLAALGAGKNGNSALRQAFYRARRRERLSLEMADEICIKLLGCHPIQVWGDAWVACALAE
jgi:hypothetical protein